MKEKLSAFSVFRGTQDKKGKLLQNGGSNRTFGIGDEHISKKKRFKKHSLRSTNRKVPTPYKVSQKSLKASVSANLDRNALSPKQPKNKIETIPILVEAKGNIHDDEAKIANTQLKQINKKRKNEISNISTISMPKPLLSTSIVSHDSARKRESVNSETHNAFELVEVPPDIPYMFDSRLEGEKCFEWLIHPEKQGNFFEKLWGRTPLLVKRHNNDYFKGLFSTDVLDNILRERNVWFGKHIDITSYTNETRETHNPPGRAFPAIVWDYYQNGCSVRFLNPQTFHRSVWKLNTTLQDFFGSFVGANVYLTPPGSQGFAPHYDDIDAFVLQLEGKKKWKLYNPRSLAETSPRFSSGNFKQSEIGTPIIETELEAGDLLYLPRGVIHQASTTPNVHSLHMTLSTHQRNTWGDFLEKLVPRALQIAFEEDLEFRQSLPKDYMQFVGVSNSDKDDPQRMDFFDSIQRLVLKLTKYLPIDATADQMAKGYVHDCLPPLLTKSEKLHSIHGCGERWHKGKVTGAIEIHPDSSVKLLRAGLVRLVMEESAVRIYHSLENSREFHQEEAQFIEISPMLAPAVEYLLHTYPHFVTIDHLPLESLEEKMEIANILYDKGLIMTEVVETVDD